MGYLNTAKDENSQSIATNPDSHPMHSTTNSQVVCWTPVIHMINKNWLQIQPLKYSRKYSHMPKLALLFIYHLLSKVRDFYIYNNYYTDQVQCSNEIETLPISKLVSIAILHFTWFRSVWKFRYFPFKVFCEYSVTN